MTQTLEVPKTQTMTEYLLETYQKEKEKTLDAIEAFESMSRIESMSKLLSEADLGLPEEVTSRTQELLALLQSKAIAQTHLMIFLQEMCNRIELGFITELGKVSLKDCLEKPRE
jgi:hypothetical protein